MDGEQKIIAIFNEAFSSLFKNGEGVCIEFDGIKYIVYKDEKNDGVHIIENKNPDIKNKQYVTVVTEEHTTFN